MMFIALKTEDGVIKGKLSFYCRMLNVTRQGFYKYLANKDRPWKYEALADAMGAIVAEDVCNDTYGRIRMYQALLLKQPEGIRIPGERTVYRVMEENGLSHRPKRRPNGITKADRQARKSDDLLKRDFTSAEPFKKCVTDITEIKAKKSGGVRTKNWTSTDSERSWITMYSQDKINIALQVYHQCGSVTNTIRVLGYPTRRALYTWIENEGIQKTPRKALDNTNTATHPRNPPVEVKMDAVHRCFEPGESIKYVSEETGCSRAGIYAWRKKYLQGGTAALMNDKNIKPGTLVEGTQDSPDAEMQHLPARMDDMQMEIDILKETINVLKKDPGINTETLKNREKAATVDALKGKYPLPLLLKQLKLPKSSYYYQETVFKKQDRYSSIRKRISALFHENNGRYGYRRIHALLSRGGTVISEKVVRRIMAEDGLAVRVKSRRKYSSYQGEILPSVPNVVNRDFHAEKPNEKWLADITEFAIPAGKACLSPIVDCFDGMLPYWTVSTTPDAALVNDMLDGAISQLGAAEHPVVHSDRGCHYRWSGWISRMEKAGLERSMSKKGCSPDNSACEGLFGRLKNEMFYNRDWTGVSIQEFIDILNEYLAWYNEKRIKISLGNMSPLEYRRSLGLAA